jgi:DNA-binding NarL/FixJ family response regulator
VVNSGEKHWPDKTLNGLDGSPLRSMDIWRNDLIRVGIVAAARTMRIGLREVLNGLPDVSVVAEAARPADWPLDEVDVLVLAAPADLNTLEKSPAVLLLTDDAADAQDLLDLELSAWGVLPADAGEEELSAALRALAEGLWVGAPALVRDLLTRRPRQELDEADFPSQPLTGRETEVLQLTAQGLANKQIAAQLGISEHTVKFHLSALYAKLGVTSRTEAVRAGARRGLVTL